MSEIVVWHEAADRFRIAIRGHDLIVDQPVHDGGGDEGPTPTELFVASLASCVAFFAGRFLSRHGMEPGGLEVDCRFSMADDRPSRVDTVTLWLRLPSEFPSELEPRLRAVVDKCTVHTSISTPPKIRMEIEVPVATI